MARRVLTILVALVAGGLATLLGWLVLISAGQPQSFRDEHGAITAGSIAEKVFIDVNGVRQGMFIKGRDATRPVLLYLHGGMPDYFLTQQHPTGMDEDFVVVWWEQRGSGISYAADIPRETLTQAQLIADAITVTDYLRDRFHQDKIYLMGHSGGSFIGIQVAARAPERGYAAAYVAIRDQAMHELGIGTRHAMRSLLFGLVIPSFQFREYTLREKINLWRGKSRSGISVVWDTMVATDLGTVVPKLAIPVYFLEGRWDYTCSARLARVYFDALQAPVKSFYTFDHSAHSPMFEEPARLRAILRADVLTGRTQLADRAGHR